MRPAWSVILLTTLIGAGQGLFVALCAAALGARQGWMPAAPDAFHAAGAALAVLLCAAGLLASFFHLGRPARAWRAAAQWRTSWLSREVIALPAFMALAAAYGIAHLPIGAAWRPALDWIAGAGLLACFALYLCTGMIYACLRFLQEWASPLTVVNFTLLGVASGFTLAVPLARIAAPRLQESLALAALALIAAAVAARGAALARNARLRPRSTLATAIGIKHPRIEQRAAGFLGGSFNTREFFHGRPDRVLRTVRWGFLAAAFVLPALCLAAGLATQAPAWMLLAVAVQWPGLLAERWAFFADARHPQNLYYRAVS